MLEHQALVQHYRRHTGKMNIPGNHSTCKDQNFNYNLFYFIIFQFVRRKIDRIIKRIIRFYFYLLNYYFILKHLLGHSYHICINRHYFCTKYFIALSTAAALPSVCILLHHGTLWYLYSFHLIHGSVSPFYVCEICAYVSYRMSTISPLDEYLSIYLSILPSIHLSTSCYSLYIICLITNNQLLSW